MYYKCFLLPALLSIFSINALAQLKYNIHFGVIGTGSFKLGILDDFSKNNETYYPLGALQILGGVYIKDEDPYAPSLLLKFGVCYDSDTYLNNNDNNVSLKTAQENLVFNPELIFPFTNQKFKLGYGLGCEYLLHKSLWINGSDDAAVRNTYYYGNMDQKQRSIIPFINFDLCFLYTSKIWLTFGIKQPLLNSYYSNESMNIAGADFHLKHQPTYFTSSVFYSFN